LSERNLGLYTNEEQLFTAYML